MSAQWDLQLAGSVQLGGLLQAADDLFGILADQEGHAVFVVVLQRFLDVVPLGLHALQARLDFRRVAWRGFEFLQALVEVYRQFVDGTFIATAKEACEIIDKSK